LIHTNADLTADVDVSCDVCIIGSGAGGSVLAAGLVQRGLNVVMLEEGGHRTREDWKVLQESISYPMLYQEQGTRATADLAITVLQGRTVGGGTTVNWTTCFRTPARILEHWERVHGVVGLDEASLTPHWEAVEERLSIAPWREEWVNPNNRTLLEGARALGWHNEILRRNVKGCASSGYCGFGCPIGAKQAMHLTFLPDALDGGMSLYANTRAERIEHQGRRVTAVRASVLDDDNRPTGVAVVVRPKVLVSSAGAINGPALLLRSELDFNGRVGKRTMLHPVVAVAALYDKRIDPWYGAPQSVTCHEFIDRGPDRVGFFLEASPMHPMLGGTAFPVAGSDQAQFMRRLAHSANTIALSVDGLLPQDHGGTVSVRSDGRPKLDYPIGPWLQESFKAATVAMAKVQLAAGANAVVTLHNEAVVVTSEADLPQLEAAPWGALQHTIFSAHQMGGCCMGDDPHSSVVDSTLRHHQVPNLFVVDGSALPTALGVNPSQSIYGLAHWAVEHVARAV